MSNDRTPEKFERQPDKPEESGALDALALLKEGAAKGGDGTLFARLRAAIKDPQGLETAEEKFDRQFKDAVAARSPERLQEMYKDNQRQLEGMKRYIASIQAQLEVKTALI